MSVSLTDHDVRALIDLAEYRLLTLRQIALLQQRSLAGLGRRWRALEREGLLVGRPRRHGHGRGRPELVFSLTAGGVAALQNREAIRRQLRADAVTGDGVRDIEHQLLVNWFRLHMVHLGRQRPRLQGRFLAPTSPSVVPAAGERSPLTATIPPKDGGRPVFFTPDGAFTICDRETGKVLLFFLEVDMGTETLASPARHRRDVRQKLANYQACFRNRAYKHYQDVFRHPLNGFRLLFLTTSESRLAALCELTRAMPPSDFVWLTDEQRMFKDGLSAAIWARGGRDQTALQSILGPALAASLPLERAS